MKKYLLNSAVITSPGVYSYHLITPSEARTWDTDGSAISTIGYEQTAVALTGILDRTILVDRRTITMLPDDEALVFRLALPPGSPRIEPGDKGRLEQAVMDGHFELGLLIRLS